VDGSTYWRIHRCSIGSVVGAAVVAIVVVFFGGELTTAAGVTVIGAVVIVVAGCWTGVVAGVVDTTALLDVLVHPAIKIMTIHTKIRKKNDFLMSSNCIY
jgi:hypothetical protein